jgi:ketosteroid isomerase-like protein
MKANAGFISLIKQDWYGLDFTYLLATNHWPFWDVFRQAVYDRDVIRHLPKETIQAKHRSIVEFYECPKEEMAERSRNRPHKYLAERHMDRFVRRATTELVCILE